MTTPSQTILSDIKIRSIYRETFRLSNEHNMIENFGRAIESAILARLGEAEPVGVAAAARQAPSTVKESLEVAPEQRVSGEARASIVRDAKHCVERMAWLPHASGIQRIDLKLFALIDRLAALAATPPADVSVQAPVAETVTLFKTGATPYWQPCTKEQAATFATYPEFVVKTFHASPLLAQNEPQAELSERVLEVRRWAVEDAARFEVKHAQPPSISAEREAQVTVPASALRQVLQFVDHKELGIDDDIALCEQALATAAPSQAEPKTEGESQ